jgi:hypothetical protein
MRKPDFFVVGAAKSGTTALWKFFQQHPEIFVTHKNENKELGYYSNQYGITNENRYLNFFKEAKSNQIIGEVCHAYLTSEESAQWIKNEIPKAKIIIILRNPIDRAYSLYNWMIMHGYENSTTFRQALIKEKKVISGKYDNKKLLHAYKQNYYYVNTGFYFNQVKRYYDAFGKENVLILEHTEFKTNMNEHMHKIYSFLNVDSFEHTENKLVNNSIQLISVNIQYKCRRVLLSKFGKNRFIKIVFSKIMVLNKVNKTPKEINRELRKTLNIHYKEDIQKLSKLTNKPFIKLWYNEGDK